MTVVCYYQILFYILYFYRITIMTDTKYFSLSELIKRDIGKEPIETFQIQAIKGKNKCVIQYIGKYTDIPLTQILSISHLEYKCDLMSFLVTNDELNDSNNIFFKMISFLIQYDNKIIASLDYSFTPNDILKVQKQKKSINDVIGTFKIVLNQKENGKHKTTIIREFIEYDGMEESIYRLASILVEDNIIEKYIETI